MSVKFFDRNNIAPLLIFIVVVSVGLLSVLLKANRPAHDILAHENAVAAKERDKGLYICATPANETDWTVEFNSKPVIVPRGTIFIRAGDSDARDGDSGEGWTRASLQDDEATHDAGAVATTNEIALTQSAPCALAGAEAVLSEYWRWRRAPIEGDASIAYRPYAIIKPAALDRRFDDDSVPLNFLTWRGRLNAVVRGTISTRLDLDEWVRSRDLYGPVEGEGNSDCFGDDSAQGISCRALNETFLLGMRGATKVDVIKAMNVRGREIDKGLHFTSRYASGLRWGAGDVSFLFDAQGRVSVIEATLDPPNPEEKLVRFKWSADRLPAGCSSLPRTRLKYCE